MLYRPQHRRRRRGGCLIRIVTFLLLIVLLAYPFAEPFMLETESVSLSSADLPSDIGQLRLVYLSDIHAGSFFSESRVENLIHTVNRLNADLVLLGGDYAVDSDSAVAFFKDMPRINSRYGVYAVMGNHDRTIPEGNLIQLKSAMISAGVTPLVNDVTSVRIGASNIYLAGIDDVDNGWPDLTDVASRVRQEDYVIFLSHSPAIIPEAHKARDAHGRNMWFDLGLFGHTHGGQIALVGDLLNISKIEDRYEEGWLVENRTNLLISRGVGTSILPIRIANRPQIHLITVKSAR
ncbi:MAG: metallophosphoesterase [Clostridiales bacterium]|nr:metallophosphoesterase [Clostridiales bacterium]